MVFIILMNQYVGVCRCISNCVPSSYLLNGRGDIKFDFFIPASGNRLCEFMLFVEETNPFSQLQQINTSHRGNQNFSWYERITPSPAALKKSKSKLKSSQNSRFIFHISKKENHKESWNSPRKSLQNANESGRLKKKPKKKKIKAFHQDSDTKRLYITSSLKKKNGGIFLIIFCNLSYGYWLIKYRQQLSLKMLHCFFFFWLVSSHIQGSAVYEEGRKDLPQSYCLVGRFRWDSIIVIIGRKKLKTLKMLHSRSKIWEESPVFYFFMRVTGW